MSKSRNQILSIIALITASALTGCVLGQAGSSGQKVYHVSVQGNDRNDGSESQMLKTISAAARLAQPGDTILVHAGIYRERINPPRGGESDTKRIVYQAALGEEVVITGSEVVKNWEKLDNDTWKVTIPNRFFGQFNPYSDLLHGDWFNAMKREHHSGAVYLNGDWLAEAAKLEEVLKPVARKSLWFGRVDKENTTIWAQFKGGDPNTQQVEINVRQTVFYPEKTGINYITVRGFTLENAATPWAPPTAEQIGLIGTHWSKGWIIENNVVRYSKCSGISLGKYGDEWDNKSSESAEGYVATINRALTNGWSKDNIGHHLVRNNTISHCEQAGIVGSLGAAFSTVTGNTIHDIYVQRLFNGFEQAGIKFHGAIDVTISGNHIYRTILGIWLDWMAQGARVSGNLLHDNGRDLFFEVGHGPYLVDNNLFFSEVLIDSQGGAYVHNLITKPVVYIKTDPRMTPFHKAHSTEVVGLHGNPSGDTRFYNNIIVPPGSLSSYDDAILPMYMAGNVFLKGANASKHETAPLVKPEFDPQIKLIEQKDGFYLELTLDKAWGTEQSRKLVGTEMLGKASIPNLPFENPDGSDVRIGADYFGKERNPANPFPGPFEIPEGGKLKLKVWPAITK